MSTAPLSVSGRAWLRPFSKLTCLATFFLIFAGGLVTSTGSGLAVPDWPLSYGMIFPPMVGGVFYEHGHRMVATVVGFLMLCLAIALGRMETRRWVRNLGFVALGAVVVQGLLGGLTVKLFLPPPVSVAHGILAQTFFLMTIVLAYSLSAERETRQHESETGNPAFLRLNLLLIFFIYLQLLFGATMRHTASGLAVPDFPTVGGEWWPQFDSLMLQRINARRFDMNLDPVSMGQVVFHILHRLGSLLVLGVLLVLNRVGLRPSAVTRKVKATLWMLNAVVALQILLGIFTVLTEKEPYLTSVHVVLGAGVLGLTVLMFVRAAPLSWGALKNLIVRFA